MLFHTIAHKILSEEASELSLFTVRSYGRGIDKVSRFKPGLLCSEINYDFIIAYKNAMTARGNKDATIAKALSVLKIFVNKIKIRGHISHNPFENVRIKQVQPRRTFLGLSELKRFYKNFMERGIQLKSGERESIRAFLFSCFTGLRYGDLKSLTHQEIQDGKIRKEMQKTGDRVYIPLSPQAQTLIPPPKNSLVFKMSDNSHFNKYLRSGAPKLGIKKYLHCHMARHTFATACITLNIPLTVTSKLLGHRTLGTTLIYAKYIDRVLDQEMKKFKKW
ncbi:MAG: site-specific integrase [Fibrobacter sp.]|jgi:integrase|nr:site-specific integrase [Fibrobacter sp.]